MAVAQNSSLLRACGRDVFITLTLMLLDRFTYNLYNKNQQSVF